MLRNDGANQWRSEEGQRGMEREDWDKSGEGSREGQSNENWRGLISIDHHRQLHYQHLLDTWWIHNHFLLCVGGCVYVYLRVYVSIPPKSIIFKPDYCNPIILNFFALTLFILCVPMYCTCVHPIYPCSPPHHYGEPFHLEHIHELMRTAVETSYWELDKVLNDKGRLRVNEGRKERTRNKMLLWAIQQQGLPLLNVLILLLLQFLKANINIIAENILFHILRFKPLY